MKELIKFFILYYNFNIICRRRITVTNRKNITSQILVRINARDLDAENNEAPQALRGGV